ncbi:MAG: M15 family metallopeptidase, partial [Bacteroidetes bacterium]|nr:M15 family metallopeptidase [Bacteroidota bacterium]
SREISDLIPIMQQKAIDIQMYCENIGVPIVIYSTRRTLQEQSKLYRQGRTGSQIRYKITRLNNLGFGFLAEILDSVGPQMEKYKVTNAGPGESWHNYGEAFDAVPLVGGKAVWNNDELWKKYGQVVTMNGLVWGGSWTSFVDKPHAQYRPGGNPLKLFSPDQIRNLLEKNGAL